MPFAYSIFALGDGALTVDFGNRIDEAINAHVLRLFRQLQNSSPYILDVLPAYSSLTVYYDVLSLRSKNSSAFAAMKSLIEPLLKTDTADVKMRQRYVNIPVCYEGKFALDIAELAAAKNLSVNEVVRLHTATSYCVYLIGFLPGFAYMGRVNERIALPRKAQPRTKVPAGSVGIAGEQTGIYPLDSPGGWNVIGRTPMKLFDATKECPVLLQPGDEISFHSITEDEFKDYQSGHA